MLSVECAAVVEMTEALSGSGGQGVELANLVVSSIPGRRTISRLVLGWVTVFGRAYHLCM